MTLYVECSATDLSGRAAFQAVAQRQIICSHSLPRLHIPVHSTYKVESRRFESHSDHSFLRTFSSQVILHPVAFVFNSDYVMRKSSSDIVNHMMH